MATKRECDRCGSMTVVGSLNDNDFREVQFHRPDSAGLDFSIPRKELCGQCVAQLKVWLARIGEQS